MITLALASALEQRSLAALDRSFLVESELRLSVTVGLITYEFVAVSPYTKTYAPSEALDACGQGVVIAAHEDATLVGGVNLSRHWNGYAFVHDLVVEQTKRRSGIASALIECAVQWAKAEGLGGVMVETQTNNVPACKLYAKCGFTLEGFDAGLYGVTPGVEREVALFWYHRSNARLPR